ncbi:MAG: alpha/beta hydrolase [Acidobacteria bacterium]|nr:alpha/beta hydrolase [Acidobacteriota bacterium]
MNTSSRSAAERTGRIRITMERSFDEFDDSRRADFLADFLLIAGCEATQVRQIAVLRGCVRYEATLDESLIEKLLWMFEAVRQGKQGPEIEAFAALIRKHQIVNINADYKLELQLVVVRPADRTIVLVHGWSGSPDSFGSLPQLLRDACRCSVSMYEYPTGKSSSNPSLIYVARNLDLWLRNHARNHRLAFVAHSYGGLVVRKLMTIQQGYPVPLDDWTKQITFVASPFDGAALATALARVPGFKTAQVKELSPNSPVLFELAEQWQQWSAKMVPEKVHVRSLVAEADEYVPVSSARGLDPHPAVILNRGHSDVVCVERSDDEVLLTILAAFRESHFTDGDGGDEVKGILALAPPAQTRKEDSHLRMVVTPVNVECPACGRVSPVLPTVEVFRCLHCDQRIVREASTGQIRRSSEGGS